MANYPNGIPSDNLGKMPGPSTRSAPGKLPTEHIGGSARADWEARLVGLRFPAGRDQLVERARAHGIDDRIIEALRNMPERQYRSIADVKQAWAHRCKACCRYLA